MGKVKRNGNIEILRFIFSILIVIHHFEKGVLSERLFTACYLGVEFFFIVTGVFLGKKLKAEKDKHSAEPFGTAAKEGSEYVWKRICSIYPYYFLAALIGFGARLLIGVNGLTAQDAASFLGDFGFVQLLDLTCFSTIGTMWYLCALFFALLLIYPFARKYYNAFVYSFAMFFPPVLVGILVKTTGDLGSITEKVFGIFSIGILRAVAMISIGLVVNELTDRVKELPTNRLNRFAFTACELFFYLALFAYCVLIPRSKFDYLAVILMALTLIVTLSEKSCLYGKLDNRFVMFLGKASIFLFLCHFFWVKFIGSYFCFLPAALPQNTVTSIALGFALTAGTSVVVYFGGNLLRFLFRKVKTALFAPPKNAA